MAADELRPGFPGWGAAIFQEAYDALADRRAAAAVRGEGALHPAPSKAAADGHLAAESALLLPDESLLRFRRGQRVECNMGDERGYVAGYVVEAWELPYQVLLDGREYCRAPIDVDQLIRAAPPDARPAEHIDRLPSLWRCVVPKDASSLSHWCASLNRCFAVATHADGAALFSPAPSQEGERIADAPAGRARVAASGPSPAADASCQAHAGCDRRICIDFCSSSIPSGNTFRPMPWCVKYACIASPYSECTRASITTTHRP